jgi:hypothetical protein
MSTKQITKGVFIDLIGSDTEIPSYDVFLTYENTKNKTLNKYTKEYSKLITQHKPTINRMAKLEEIVLQLRAIEKVDDIKLSLVRDYIYARTPFFRLGKTTKDIRVLVDRSEFWTTDLESLLTNEAFMIKAKNKLIDAMNEEVSSNIKEFESTK